MAAGSSSAGIVLAATGSHLQRNAFGVRAHDTCKTGDDSRGTEWASVEARGDAGAAGAGRGAAAAARRIVSARRLYRHAPVSRHPAPPHRPASIAHPQLRPRTASCCHLHHHHLQHRGVSGNREPLDHKIWCMIFCIQ
ncbi:hypothetical protein O0L34_g2440 [Tuta absoluta]|nr:hypothetical protein O0L34_g2440 [Tuta absoluta]